MKKLQILIAFIIILYGCKKDIAPNTNVEVKPTNQLVKQFISADAWRNNVQVNDWSTQNGDKVIWFDMDLDGHSDKLDFVTNNSNQFFLKIFKYVGENYIATIDVNSIVRNNALHKFIIDSMYIGNIPSFGSGRIAITDYNKDSIPDIIFSIMKQEDQANVYMYPAYQLVLLSKGVLDYELKIFPSYFRCGDQDVYGDFNGDGKTDIITPNAIHSDTYYPGLPNATKIVSYVNSDVTNFTNVVVGNGAFQGTAYINDFDKNGISDVIIGEMDNGFSVYGSMGGFYHTGIGPMLYMNYRNGIATNTIVLEDMEFKAKWQTNNRFNMTEHITFSDLNSDGYVDLLITKSHDTYNVKSDYNIDTLKGERLYQIFINYGGTKYIDETNKYFPNNTNYIKIPHTNPGDFIPDRPKLIDADGDGKIDIVFNTYKFYYKNINNQFILQHSNTGFVFNSQKYKSFSNN